MSAGLTFKFHSCIRCTPLIPASRHGNHFQTALRASLTQHTPLKPIRSHHLNVMLFSSNGHRPRNTLHEPLKPSSMLAGAPRWIRRYTNAQNNYGYSPDGPENTKFIWLIIGANAAVFLAWQWVIMRNQPKVSTQTGRREPVPPAAQGLYEYLRKYFLLRVNDVKEGNYLSSLGSAFSHTSTTHFLGNMITMFAFGARLGAVPGIRISHLAQLVFGSALCGSAGFMLYESRQGSQGRNRTALGASGVVMGLGAATFALVPKTTFLIYGIIPIQIGLLVPAYFALDAFYLDDPNSRVAHSGHLGGAAFGLLFCALRFRGVGGIFGR